MGLYDRYILHNSTAIPTFNGSELDAIRRTNDTLGKAYEMKQAQYDKTDELLNATGDAVAHTPYDDIDKDTWNQINKETQDEINGYMTKGNLEDLYSNANKLAKRVAPKIIGLSNQVKAMQEARKLLGSKEYNLDPNQQQTLLEMAKADYKKRGGIKFDGYGNVISGTEFSMGPVAEYVDRPEEIRKALSMMHANEFDSVVKTDDGFIGRKQGRKDTYIRPEDVMAATQYAKSLNNKWQAYDDQERKVMEFNSFKGLNDNNALQMIQGMEDNIKVPVKGKGGKTHYEMQPNPIKAQLTTAIQKGASPMSLLKAIKSNQIAEQQRANELGYAKSKVYHETKIDNEQTVGPLYEWEYKRKAEIDEGITMPSTNTSIPADEDLSKIDEKIKTTGEEVGTAKKIVEQWVQLDKDGQPVMKNGQYIPVNGKDLSKMPFNVQNAISALDSKVATLKGLNSRKTAALDEAAAKKGFAAEDGSKVGSYKRMQASNNNAVADLIEGNTDFGVFRTTTWNGQYASEAGTITKQQLADKIRKGEVTWNEDGGNLYLNDGTVVNLNNWNRSSKLFNGIESIEKRHTTIKEDANKNWQTYAQSSVVNPGASLDFSNQHLKAFGDNIVSTIRTNRGGLDWTDDSDTPISKEDVSKLNLKDAIPGTAYKFGNKVIQTISIPGKDGEGDKTFKVAFPANSNIGDRYRKITGNSKDEKVREFTMSLDPQSINQQVSQLEPFGKMEVRPGSNIYIERSNDQNQAAFSIGILQPDGTMKYLNNAKGTKFYTSSALTAETEALKHLH